MVVGIGIDVASVQRMAAAIDRHGTRFVERLLSAEEVRQLGRRATDATTVAGRFAAKEALSKALGGPPDVWWHDVEVLVGPRGGPELRLLGPAEAHARRLGVRRALLSITHDAGVAAAVVVLDADAGAAAPLDAEAAGAAGSAERAEVSRVQDAAASAADRTAAVAASPAAAGREPTQREEPA